MVTLVVLLALFLGGKVDVVGSSELKSENGQQSIDLSKAVKDFLRFVMSTVKSS